MASNHSSGGLLAFRYRNLIERYRSSIYDPVSALPAVEFTFASIAKAIHTQKRLGLVYVDLNPSGKLEDVVGWQLFDTLIAATAQFLKQNIVKFKDVRLVSLNRTPLDAFLIFLSGRDGRQVEAQRLEGVARALHRDLEKHFKRKMTPKLDFEPDFAVEFSILEPNPRMRLARCIQNSIREISALAGNRATLEMSGHKARLKEIIYSKQIQTLFQPVLDLKSRHVIGFEPLSRGPTDTPYQAPDFLFNLAKEFNLIPELDRLCLEKALDSFKRLRKGQFLFVNVMPSLFANYDLYNGTLLPSLGQTDRIVLEITEREAIKDFALFKRAILEFRKAGFKLAVDDVGTGYASLEMIIQIRPEFIKIDHTLINGIAGDFIKQDIVNTIVDLAGRIGSQPIAEGIEDGQDYRFLLTTAIPFGQGFYFARPTRELVHKV